MTARRMCIGCLLMTSWLLVQSSSTAALPFHHNLLRAQHLQHRRAEETLPASSEEFVQECKSYLLSTGTVDDGLISQDEFAQFLSSLCVQLDACPPGTELDFANLSVELQLSFVLFICSQDDQVERQACLEQLKEAEEPFGYDLNVEELDLLETEMEELCSQAHLYASESGLLPPTIAPSQAPLAAPSAAPTLSESNTGGGNDNNTATDDASDPNKGTGAGDTSGGTWSGNESVSVGLIVGVTIAAVAICLAATLLAVRRKKRRTGALKGNNQHKYVADVNITGDESIFTEDSDAFKYIPKGMASFSSARSAASAASSGKGSHRSSRSFGSSSTGEHLPHDVVMGIKSRSIAQFDPTNAAAAIALGIGGEIVRRGDDASSTRSSHKSSPQLSMDSDKHGKMHNLTAAIETADWDEVARLAGTMASDDSEEISTMSEYSSAREQLSSVSSINSGDSVRVAQIEEMALRGDWSAVANAAQYFSSAKSLGDAASGVASNTGDSSSPQRRSFLDFVTGRRAAPSAAASAAILPNSPDLVELDHDTSEAGMAHVGATDDIPSILDAGQSNTMETQSSSSRGSRQGADDSGVAGSKLNQKRKKRWYRKLMSSTRSISKKGSSDSADAIPIEEVAVTTSSTKKLQAELDDALERSDWVAVEAISAQLDEFSGVSSRQTTSDVGKHNVSETEQEAVLGATRRSTAKSAKRPGESSATSYRADIDKAVADGDWDAVERLTTQILNAKPSPSTNEAMADTLIETNNTANSLFSLSPSPSKSTSSKSPFRATPSSSEWSLSPPNEEEKRQKIRRLISAKDWKGVHVLSGIYEMETKGIMPPASNMSKDSAESPDFARGWLQGGNASGTPPPPDTEGAAHPPPPSPSTSTSTGASSDYREFERLVNAKDWKGLASFAGAEEELDHEDDEGKLLPRNLFQLDQTIPKRAGGHVNAEDEDIAHAHLREQVDERKGRVNEKDSTTFSKTSALSKRKKEDP